MRSSACMLGWLTIAQKLCETCFLLLKLLPLPVWLFHLNSYAHSHGCLFWGCCFMLAYVCSMLSSVWVFVCSAIPVYATELSILLCSVLLLIFRLSRFIGCILLNSSWFHQMKMPLGSLTQTGRDVETRNLWESRLKLSHVCFNIFLEGVLTNASNKQIWWRLNQPKSRFNSTFYVDSFLRSIMSIRFTVQIQIRSHLEISLL